jgi:polar amino acid transport system substrate-binding protein
MNKQSSVKLILPVICVILLGLIVYAEDKPGVSTGQIQNRVLEKKVLVVGLEPSYPPFEFKSAAKEIVGFDVDIANLLAKKLGVSVKIKEVAWQELIPSLDKDEIDMVISGMTRTSSRAKEVDFTDPYFVTGQIVVMNKKTKGLDKITDLNYKKYKIGVQKGTTGEQAALDNFPEAMIKSYDDIAACQKDLLNRKVDVMVCDKPLAEDFVRVNAAKLSLPFDQFTTEEYCVALKKGDSSFISWLNSFITEFKVGTDYNTIFNKWFKK